jgi:crotonobetainyl-CoA:carnitine CoA-transferase CaiB-like acyl-CoA transferase
MGLPLDGVRVLELSGGVAAALAGRFLRGYGADVRRIAAPSVVELTDDQVVACHAGKPVLALPVGAAAWDALFASVDLVVSDRQPAALAALGLDWEAVHARHPHLVIVSATPFGLAGPCADWAGPNAVGFALGGIMSLTGDPGRTPLVTGGDQAEKLLGLNAFAVAVTCWYGRRRHGVGELVDLSGQECAAGMTELYGPSSSVGGPVIPRLGNHTRAPWAIYPCLDGWVGVFCLARQIPGLFAMLDDPELAEPRFTDPLQRGEPLNEEALTAKLYVHFMERTVAEIQAAGLALRVPVGVAVTPADLLASPGLAVRGAFEQRADGTRLPGAVFPGFGWRGADTPAVGAEELWAPRPVDPAVADAPRGRLPLEGIRVVDLSMMWAGPYATAQLGAMGADVIKVESPRAWDNIRTLVPQPGVADPWNSAYYFVAYNRDKRSLTLDLAQPEGVAAMKRLLASADVLLENYRADVLDKLGFTDEVLREVNPSLVTISMAAFGKAGPDRDYVGFGPVIELMSGLASLTGYEHDEEPFKTGISYGDPVAGLAAVSATVLGLARRDDLRVDGDPEPGIHVDLAQRETGMALVPEAFVAANRGEVPVHRGCRDARFAPQGVYRTADATDGWEQWVVVLVRTDDEWRALCGLLGRDDLSGLSVAERHARHDELDAVLAAWLRPQRPQPVTERLQAAGVPAGRVHDSSSIHDDVQLLHRDYWVYLPQPKMIRHKQQGVHWRLHDAAPVPRLHAPLFGEHNEAILAELGYGPGDRARLTELEVIADAPVNPTVG